MMVPVTIKDENGSNAGARTALMLGFTLLILDALT